jgi:hypothetical protein
MAPAPHVRENALACWVFLLERGLATVSDVWFRSSSFAFLSLDVLFSKASCPSLSDGFLLVSLSVVGVT